MEMKSPKTSNTREQNSRTKRAVCFGAARHWQAIFNSSSWADPASSHSTGGEWDRKLCEGHLVGRRAPGAGGASSLHQGGGMQWWKMSYQHTPASDCLGPALPHQHVSVQGRISWAHHLPLMPIADVTQDFSIDWGQGAGMPQRREDDYNWSSPPANQGLGTCRLIYSTR